MKWNWPFLLLTAVLLAGCDGRPTELERTSSLLKEGMTKNKVHGKPNYLALTEHAVHG